MAQVVKRSSCTNGSSANPVTLDYLAICYRVLHSAFNYIEHTYLPVSLQAHYRHRVLATFVSSVMRAHGMVAQSTNQRHPRFTR